jgi:hypothetical protein
MDASVAGTEGLAALTFTSRMADLPVVRVAGLPYLGREIRAAHEVLTGVGTEWVYSKQFGITANSVSGEAVADFMFWRSAKHRFGWYLEPTFEYSFAGGHEKSVGLTGGLLLLRALNK